MTSYTDFLSSTPTAAGIPSDYREVTPSDTEDNLPAGTIGLIIGATGGEIVAITAADNTVTLPVQAYGTISGRFRRVMETGTTVGEVFAAVM